MIPDDRLNRLIRRRRLRGGGEVGDHVHDDDDERSDDERVALKHAPPGYVIQTQKYTNKKHLLMVLCSPCYDNLQNNVPTRLMRTKLNAWPDGTPDFVPHTVLRDYIQDTARKCGAEEMTIYGARVLRVRKVDSRWEVTWSVLRRGQQQRWKEERHRSVGTVQMIFGRSFFFVDSPDIRRCRCRVRTLPCPPNPRYPRPGGRESAVAGSDLAFEIV